MSERKMPKPSRPSQSAFPPAESWWFEVASMSSLLAYIGPEMPPSLRTRQKWTAIRIVATNGMPTQWST